MELVNPATGITPTIDGIGIHYLGRMFGLSDTSAKLRYDQAIPATGFFDNVREELLDLSQILKLKMDPDLTLGQLVSAYTADLSLLNERREEFQEFIRSAIRASVRMSGNTGWAMTEQPWNMMQKDIPTIGKAALIQLSADSAAQLPNKVLLHLKNQVRDGVERLLQLFAFHIQQMVEEEYVGLAEKTGNQVYRFHYFRHEISSVVVGQQSSQTVEGDVMVDHMVHTRTETTKRNTQFRERHVHHILEANEHVLEQFPNKVPADAVKFLDVVPAWIKSHLRILDGTLTMREVIRTKEKDKTSVEVETTSEARYDPGIILDEFVLFGWLETNNVEMSSIPVRQNDKVEGFHHKIIVLIACLLGFASASGLVYIGFSLWNSSREQAYASYVEPLSANAVTTKRGEKLKIGGQEINLRYSGISGFSTGTDGPGLVAGESKDPSGKLIRSFRFNLKSALIGGVEYGDIDLGPVFGIYATMKVIEYDRQEIKYVIEPYSYEP